MNVVQINFKLRDLNYGLTFLSIAAGLVSFFINLFLILNLTGTIIFFIITSFAYGTGLTFFFIEKNVIPNSQQRIICHTLLFSLFYWGTHYLIQF